MDTSLITMPVTFKVGDIMSEDEFFRFCQMNDMLNLERDKHGNIIFMSPTGTSTGSFNLEVSTALAIWLKTHGIAGKLFDSSTGITLPNGAVRSPDLSWISRDKWDTLSIKDKERFAPICPEFIIEVRSKSDSLRYLQDKMQEYIDNGCQLAWLIDRFKERVSIYRSGREIEHINSFNTPLSGDPLFPGFKLDLSLIDQS
ncbi:Uma2 family endonuclease [Dyadobacter chenhuakuii]|uniref:Uma2 family endonuclease n=1 Tax=Dyadobacter chenhuakuii TaxID=2909339 RepID=A0A9X1QJZ5_9BACT|nr:Uma2 family endonuclease [Dyadobacter chenhuakuii]MCF2501079.1 Uma2 family endonuclease [Dyadobacter chenhuakuii]